MTTLDRLRPPTAPLAEPWSSETLATIMASPRDAAPALRSHRRRAHRLAAAGVALVAVGGGAAAYAAHPWAEVHDAFQSFSDHDGDGSRVGDPTMVVDFTTVSGRRFTAFTATTSSGEQCTATAEDWRPVATDTLAWGCGAPGAAPFGGFFEDNDGPLVYGLSPYPGATSVHVTAPGVDQTLSVDPASHGYGAALPGADDVRVVTLTFLDASGAALGTVSERAPRG